MLRLKTNPSTFKYGQDTSDTGCATGGGSFPSDALAATRAGNGGKEGVGTSYRTIINFHNLFIYIYISLVKYYIYMYHKI